MDQRGHSSKETHLHIPAALLTNHQLLSTPHTSTFNTPPLRTPDPHPTAAAATLRG